MKTLGIDYGRRRIGVAVTDNTGTYIKGLTSIDQKKKNPLESLSNIIKEQKPQKIVFGVPLSSFGEETEMSQEVRQFAQELIDFLESPIPVDFIDESYSSQTAHHILSFRKKKVRETKGNVDMIAACEILRTYQREQGFDC